MGVPFIHTVHVSGYVPPAAGAVKKFGSKITLSPGLTSLPVYVVRYRVSDTLPATQSPSSSTSAQESQREYSSSFTLLYPNLRYRKLFGAVPKAPECCATTCVEENQ